MFSISAALGVLCASAVNEFLPALPTAVQCASTLSFWSMSALSRRHFLHTVLAAAASTSVAQAVAQSPAAPAYSVGKWSGPLSAFHVTDLDGKSWQPADLAGRAVLLNFWASWCEPCRAEMPALQQLADRHGAERLLVLAINFKEKPARALQFAKSTGLTLPVLLDTDGQLAQRWGVRVFPTTLTIDSQGHRATGCRARLTGASLRRKKSLTAFCFDRPEARLLECFAGGGDNRRLTSRRLPHASTSRPKAAAGALSKSRPALTFPGPTARPASGCRFHRSISTISVRWKTAFSATATPNSWPTARTAPGCCMSNSPLARPNPLSS